MKKEKVSLEKKHKPETDIVNEPVVESQPVAEIGELAVSKVGSLLKEMRLRKALKVADVAKKLCIRKFYLEAIEESRYRDIPEFPYGAGFIRSYADFLGLNGSNIVELYKEETESKPEKDIFVLEPQTEATVPGKKYLLISLLALILVYVMWFIYNNHNSTDFDEAVEVLPAAAQIEEVSDTAPLVVEDYSIGAEVSDNKSAAEPIAFIDTTAVSADANSNVVMTDKAFPGVVEKTAEPVEVVMAEPVVVKTTTAENLTTVTVRVKEETWVEVKDKDHLYISKVLKAGDAYVLPNNGVGMVLSVGRPEAVDVAINGVVTPVVSAAKKTNIAIDKFLTAANR